MTTAFVWTLLAGAATAVGGLIAVHRRVRSDTGLALALGFAAGAMVLVSVAEILPKGVAGLTPLLGVPWAVVLTLTLALAGASGVRLLARSLDGALDRSSARRTPKGVAPVRRQVLRSGTVVALAVTAHNVPEGLATFVATVEDPTAGAAVAFAIAIHNVPEGVAVAAPMYGAGSSRRRALGAASASGLAEPLGAVLGYLLLAALLPASAFGAVFGVLAGVMLMLSVAELLPNALRLAPTRHVALACATGATVMTLSLVLLRVV